MSDYIVRPIAALIILIIIWSISYFVVGFKIGGFNLFIVAWLAFNTIDIVRLEQDNE